MPSPSVLGSRPTATSTRSERSGSLAEIYGRPAKLVRKGEETVIVGPLGLFDAIMAFGRKGIRAPVPGIPRLMHGAVFFEDAQ